MILTLDKLYTLLKEPCKLDSETLEPLRELMESYPYSSTLAFLYLYNLHRVGDVRYPAELHRLSPLLPNRQKLYRMVELDWEDSLALEPESGSFSRVDDFLGKAQAQGEMLPATLEYEGTSEGGDDYFASLGQVVEQVEPLVLGMSDAPLCVPDSVAGHEDASKGSESSKSGGEEELGDGFFTETLARIYIQQGKYERALRIFNSLDLKYPGKSRYFADQIRFLERLIQVNNQSTTR